MAILLMICVSLLKDFLLLRMGPRAKLFYRVRLYAASLLAWEFVFSAATLSLSTVRIIQIVESPLAVLTLALLYGALAVLCFWLRRTERHDVAWFAAIIPNPLLVIGISLVARYATSPDGAVIGLIGPALLACLWIAIIALWANGAKRSLLDVRDLDFTLSLSGFVNAVTLCLLPVESVFSNPNGWSDVVHRVATVFSAN